MTVGLGHTHLSSKQGRDCRRSGFGGEGSREGVQLGVGGSDAAVHVHVGIGRQHQRLCSTRVLR